MNAELTLTVWLQLLGLLAVEVALVVGAAALIPRLAASAAWRRTVWQVCFSGVLALTLSELTGTARSAAGWLSVKARPENLTTARPTAAYQSEEPPASGRLPEALRNKVATQFSREHQQEGVATAEAISLVIPLSGADSQRMPAPTDMPAKQDPANSAGVGGDSVADSLAILWLGLIWLIGTGLVTARGCLAHALFAVFRRHRRAVSDPVLRGRVEALARRLGVGRRIQLVESSWLASPIVFGLFRPAIGLPTGFAERFSPVQQEAMLAHELAHLTAHDPAWYLLANCASAILWWHPLVWWARRRLHAASEMAADEASLVVVEGPVVLAECLAEMGARLAQRRSFVWLGVEGNGLRSGLGQRVERLVRLHGNLPASQDRLGPSLAKILGPAALVATAILSTAWVSPQAFSKGESMNTMKQTLRRSLAAFALLTTLGTDNQTALAANAVQPASGQNTSPATATSTSTAEKPTAPDPATKPPAAEPASSQDQYYRLMMERYKIIPKGTSPPIVDPLTKKQRTPIATRLEKIVLDEVVLDGVPLPEVLRFLDEESRKRDPEKHGINFLINPNGPPVATGQTVDPTTGLAILLPSPEPLDMNSVIVRFNLPLRNMRLKDVLDAIVKVADRPIAYSVEEYGVVFSQSLNPSTASTSRVSSSSAEQGPLEVRTFMVDTNTFLAGLKRAFGTGSDTNDIASTQQIRSTLRDVFIRLGINMDVPGKTVFYNDLTGIVMVRATLEDLEIVRAAVETLGGSGIGQFAQPGQAKEGAVLRFNEEMMRRYGIHPPTK